MSDDDNGDLLLRRYLRCVNYAEALRILAERKAERTDRDLLLSAAGCFDSAGDSLRALLLNRNVF
jgi:hypothetical protein